MSPLRLVLLGIGFLGVALAVIFSFAMPVDHSRIWVPISLAVGMTALIFGIRKKGERLRLVLWVPLVGFLIFLVVFAIGLGQPEQKVVPSALRNQPVPEFTLAPAMVGRPGLSSADLRRGQPRLINIFASWCIPCREEAPQLEQLARQGIPIDGIAVRDRPEDLARFLQTYGDPFRSIGADIDRRVQLNLGSAGVPETFIVDGRGIIRHQHIGAIYPSDIPAIMTAWQEASR